MARVAVPGNNAARLMSEPHPDQAVLARAGTVLRARAYAGTLRVTIATALDFTRFGPTYFEPVQTAAPMRTEPKSLDYWGPHATRPASLRDGLPDPLGQIDLLPDAAQETEDILGDRPITPALPAENPRYGTPMGG